MELSVFFFFFFFLFFLPIGISPHNCVNLGAGVCATSPWGDLKASSPVPGEKTVGQTWVRSRDRPGAGPDRLAHGDAGGL